MKTTAFSSSSFLGQWRWRGELYAVMAIEKELQTGKPKGVDGRGACDVPSAIVPVMCLRWACQVVEMLVNQKWLT